jgi:hypothetical protein
MSAKTNLRAVPERPSLDQLAIDASEMSRGEVLALIGDAARLMAVLQARLAQLAGPGQEQHGDRIDDRNDRLLTAQQAAVKLSVSVQWVYQRWEKLGGVKLDNSTLRFPEAQLDGYIRNRRSG